MIAWVQDYCLMYGVKMRRHVLGGRYYDNPDGTRQFHFDGAAAKSLMHRISQWGVGALDGEVVQHYPQWLEGEALEVWRAAQGLIEHRRYLLDIHYLIPKQEVPTKQKVQSMRELFPDRVKNKQAYYDEMDRLHEWLAARMPRDVPRETFSRDSVATQ